MINYGRMDPPPRRQIMLKQMYLSIPLWAFPLFSQRPDPGIRLAKLELDSLFLNLVQVVSNTKG